MKRIRKILVATDFSGSAREALFFAVELAQRFQASLAVLHVYQAPSLPIPTYPTPPPSMVAELAKLLDEIDRALAALRSEIRERGGPEVATLTAEGTPVREILQELRDGEYDLLVVGTHGRTGFRHALLGSVAEKVVRSAPCPVLTVRYSAEPREGHLAAQNR
jgi:universal stress protein A